MDILDKNWLTSDPADFEYKSYLILAYEQKLKADFNAYILYPQFDDLLFKMKESRKFIDNKAMLNISKQSIEKIDSVNYKLIYKSDIADERIELLESIAKFAYSKFKSCYLLAETKFEEVYTDLKIFDLQLHKKTFDTIGLIILQIKNVLKIYSYELIKLIDDNEIIHGINLKLIEECQNSTSYINILRNQTTENVFLVKTQLEIDDFSMTTILKKKMINYLSNNID